MRWILIVGGLLLILSGAVWTLQGLNLLGGSSMSGDKTWAVIGPLAALAGIVALRGGLRRNP
ncbi:hypothetical protein GCM10009682_15770 [Luedemannella flava]|uniref:Uncharacterized protein n=1 Tax=Luedemannella flava TaxID=349316 RepID=A0ABP4XX67_9ACTN